MNERDVVLAPLPQADGRMKNRPVIVLRQMPPFGDLFVCGVSTQLHLRVENFDELILNRDADFTDSGLKATSLIRLGFLAVLPATNILGRIGSISVERHQRLLERLCQHLKSSSTA
jgi:mRNA interferase MazF